MTSTTRSGWYILDEGRVYINRAFPTEREALVVLDDLLKPYPAHDVWRRRLRVRFLS